MNLIKRSAIIHYTARQMFELVNDIEQYPQFLPWCHASHLILKTDQQIEAKLDIAWSGIHKSFTTRNTLTPYEKIDITLVNGPFKHLEGIWCFTSLENQGCKVELELEFELTGHFFDRLFQPIFNHIANSLVDLFCKRAVDIYGTQ